MSKYKVPISRPETVSVPRWEYAQLIDKATKLRIIERMVKEMQLPSYQWEGVMKIVFEKEEE